MAQMEVTPDPVPVGEQFQVKGVGYIVDVPVTVAVDGQDVGTVLPSPSPDGGQFMFQWAINEVGSYEITAEQTAPDDMEDPPDDLKGTDQLEVVTGWAHLDEPVPPEDDTVEPEAESKSRKAPEKKTVRHKDEES